MNESVSDAMQLDINIQTLFSTSDVYQENR